MGTFTHLDPDHPPHGLPAILRWAILDRLTRRRVVAPAGPGAPWTEPDLASIHGADRGPRLTWLGHASFLLRLGGRNVLIDPVLGRRRLGFFYRRHVPPGLTAEQLPAIDLLLITHAHYDHLDAPTLRRLPADTPALVPLGLGRWFHRRGFRAVRELGWWQRAEAGPLRVTMTPARHWSRRTPFDLNRSLWGGYAIEADGVTVYHAGDSAWCQRFAEIGERFPRLDLALLPIGAYRPAWFMEHSHLNPEQAGRAFLALGAHRLVPMHWGTFQLTDEPIAEPAERLAAWWRKRGPSDRRLCWLAVGETLRLGVDPD